MRWIETPFDLTHQWLTRRVGAPDGQIGFGLNRAGERSYVSPALYQRMQDGAHGMGERSIAAHH